MGLSYTRFSYGKPTISRNEVPVGEILAVHKPVASVGVDVTNTGNVAGAEVVQLYLRNTAASVEQPVRELKALRAFSLHPARPGMWTFRWALMS